MGRPNREAICTPQEVTRPLQGIAGYLGLSILLLMSGCAQIDQLMGNGTDSVKPAPGVSTQKATPPQPAQSVVKPVTKTPSDGPPANATTESLPQTPVAAPARPPTEATGMAQEPDPESRNSEQDKALVEKEQPAKEKKSRAASDRKSKKSAKPRPPAEDDSLPPLPPPSKPAAIGGSGG